MSLASGVLVAWALLILPGAIIARTAQLTWPVSVAVAPALTYGTVALAILPFGAVGIPWNLWTALLVLVVVVILIAVLQAAFAHRRVPTPAGAPMTLGPALVIAAGAVLGASLITFAAIRGMPHWQSIPSTWDSVWHANTVRFIVETGQASPTHMGELRNVETHAALYYPSAFHALAAMQCELTGASATMAYTLNSLAASVWLFPVSAAVLTWHLLRGRSVGQWPAAGSAAAAAALAASFTAIPYVEFDTASMPNLAAYGLAVPTMVLIVSSLRHRDRIPLAVLALLGVFSVHITGGVVTVLFVVMWWLCEGLWRPVRGRLADFIGLAAVAGPAVVLLLPQFVGVLQQAEIIAGHEFDTHEGKKKALFDAVVQHTRHLNDYPIQNALILLAAIGFVVLLVRRIWWPAAIWLVLVYSIVHSSAPFGGALGKINALFTDLFYSDPRRLSGVVTLLLAPMAGIALFALATAAMTGLRGLTPRLSARASYVATAVILVAVPIGMAWHYFPRHRHLIGEKYDQVIIDDRDLEAFAYLATLPGARDTLIGNANTDGTAWMYAVSGLHPLWTHYDFPQQQGPGYHRFIFWAYADAADHDPRVAEAVRALNIRYVITSSPVVRGFVMPDGLVSLGESKSWREIYDNGEDHIYEWQGKVEMTNSADGNDIEIIGDLSSMGDDADGKSLSDLVEQPAKVMRIGTMIKQLLEEVRAAPLDDASRNRLREIHARSVSELEEGLAPELREELERLTLPFSEDKLPTDAELRIAQAQLVGWLEGLFHGIQTALFAQQMAARAQLESMRQGALPPGVGGAPGQRGPAGPGTGQYL